MARELSKTASGPVLHEAERIIDPDQCGLVYTAERGRRLAFFSTAGRALSTPINVSRIEGTVEQGKCCLVPVFEVDPGVRR